MKMKKREPCPICGQVDEGQTGEHPCPECGLPWLHDEHPGTDVLLREAGDIINGDGTHNVIDNLIALQRVLDPDSEGFHIERDETGRPISLIWEAL